jgi:hypothetical protein
MMEKELVNSISIIIEKTHPLNFPWDFKSCQKLAKGNKS